MLAELFDRVFLSGYEAAKRRSLLSIIGRLSRGNTAVQDQQVIDDADMGELRLDGEDALRRLKKKLGQFRSDAA